MHPSYAFCGWLAIGAIGLVRAADAPRWAVVSAESSAARNVTELVTVELSHWSDVQLVERDAVDRVLAELKVNASGLVAGDRQVEFGKLLSAEVVLFVELPEKLRPPQYRLRAIETRTGIRLLDQLLPVTTLETDTITIRDALRQAKDRWRVPQDNRRYVAVLTVHSEEPGDALASQAAALAALLDHDLQETPTVLVLEREQLNRLRQEEQLTGVELELRSAATLIEAGMRREESGKVLAFSLRLSSLSGQPPRTDRFVVPFGDLNAARLELAQHCGELLSFSASPRAAADHDLAHEAEIFSHRATWLRSNDRLEEALVMAEAALALHPVREHYLQAFHTHDRIWSRDFRALRVDIHHFRDPEKIRQKQFELLISLLRTARRMHELDLIQLRMPTESPDGPVSFDVNGVPFHPHTPRVWTEPEPEELQRLRGAVDSMRLEKFQLLCEAATSRQRSTVDLLIQRLGLSYYFAESAQQLCEQTLAWQQELDDEFERESRRLEKLYGRTDSRYSALVKKRGKNVAALLQQRRSVGELDSSDDELRTWSAEELAPLWSELTRHELLSLQAVGFAGLADLPGNPGTDAALSLLKLLEQMTFDVNLGFPPTALDNLALRRLQLAGKLEEIGEQRLAEAERTRDPRSLWNRRPGFKMMVWFGKSGNDTQSKQWARRVITLIDEFHTSDETEVKEASYQREQYLNLLTPGNVALPAELRPPEPMSGPWSRYRRRTLPLDRPPDDNFGRPMHMIVDREPKEGNPSLLSFWQVDSGKDGGQLLIGRTGLSGGEVTEVGRVRRYGLPKIATTGGGSIFVNSEEAGLAVLDSRTPYFYGPAQGFPGQRVSDFEWLEGALYVGLGNGLARFDPQRQQFEVLATNLAIEVKGPFDAGGRYRIPDLLADSARGHVWFTVQGDESHRGVWKYTCQANTWQRVYSARSGRYMSHLWWAGDKIHFLADFAWQELDPARSLVTEIAEYPRFNRRNHPAFIRGFLQSGEDIISADGQMYTLDGQLARYPQRGSWQLVGTVPEGFLVLDQTDGLILFQRRTAP